jgi:hypothetical protein
MAIIEGTAYWASVKRPNTTYEPVYSVNLVIDEESAKDFKRRGFSIKDMQEGPALIIKRKVNGGPKGTREAPKLFDRSKNEVDLEVGNGSKVKVQYREWEMDRKGQHFQGLEFIAMQILDLVPYKNGGIGDEFEVEDSLQEEDEL